MSRCAYLTFDKQYTIPVILFFTLGIMHKKLIFIYIMVPNVWEKVFNCPYYVFHLYYAKGETAKKL